MLQTVPLRPCHQLDFGTSGLLVLAKSQAALSATSQAFDSSSASDDSRGAGAAYSVDKEYTAIVLGWPRWDSFDWSGELDADPSSPFKLRVVSECHARANVGEGDAKGEAGLGIGSMGTPLLALTLRRSLMC